MAATTPSVSPSVSLQRDQRPVVAQPMLQLRGLAGAADGALLHEVTLDVARGETMALLGPQGGGHVLLMLLAGFVRADAGEMLLDSRPIGRTPVHRRPIGLVERDAALLPHLTLAQNVALPLRLRGAPRAAQADRLGEVLELLGLADMAGKLPAALPAEARLRGALARALACAPKLLLLDDAFAGLDQAGREALQMLLYRVHASQGGTTLLATSDPAEALLLGDRVAVFSDGRLRQVGTPQALYEQPANALVARSLGAANLLGGTYVRPDEDMAEIHLDCGIAVLARPVDAVRGQRCVVMVRPERVALAAVSAAEMGEGALPAVVEDVFYQGAHVQLRLRVGAPGARTGVLVVRRPAGAPLSGLEPGRTAAVAWQPHHAAAFRPEPGR